MHARSEKEGTMAQQRPIPLQWVTVGHGRLAIWGRPSSVSVQT